MFWRNDPAVGFLLAMNGRGAFQDNRVVGPCVPLGISGDPESETTWSEHTNRRLKCRL